MYGFSATFNLVSFSYELKMPSCSVPDCNNRSAKDKIRGVTFHQLPVWNPHFAKQWLDQLRRDERFGFPKNLENVYVCNEHFNDDCFKTDYRFELLGGNTRKRSVKNDAVPTKFKRNARAKQRLTSERGIAKKERKEVRSYVKRFHYRNSFTELQLVQ